MKIWALEKLQRMMTTMFEGDTGLQIIHGHNTRSNSVQGSVAVPRANRQADLSQLLQNERIHGPSDRDPTVATKELTLFKGPFIYIHDIDERQRPIMVREYNKVANKEDGDWPQFRSVAHGKCPFVEEVDKRELEKDRELMRLQRQQEKEKAMVPRTRGAAAVEASRMQPPKTAITKRVLADTGTGSNRNVTVTSKQSNPFEIPKKPYSHRMEVESSSRGNAFVSRAGPSHQVFRGEPVASGLQASMVTSAIRSQMISSTAAQPGAKVGTSKEVHGLQRKVLEKNSGGPGSYGIASSHRMTENNAPVKEEMTSRPAKRKHEKLDLIEEDVDPSEQEDNARKVEAAHKTEAIQQRKLEKRDPKPGYCENCQDKFEDFDEVWPSKMHLLLPLTIL
jgi:regulatory subunit for Cdc7p protein kinase